MDPATAIKAFAVTDGPLPVEAIRWALEHWEEAFPDFLTVLEEYPIGVEADTGTSLAAFFIVHLCGDMAEKRVFPVLCRLFRDPITSNDLLGDSTTETLHGILIRTFAGDLAPLLAVVEARDADEFVRNAALTAMAYLTRTGSIPDLTTRFHLAHLGASLLPRSDNFVWVGLATAIATLGYGDLWPWVDAAFEEGLINDYARSELEFKDLLRLSMEDPSGMAGFRDYGIEPHTDTITVLSRWSQASTTGNTAGKSPPAGRAPVRLTGNPNQRINPHRQVGRNDPCPCGSGKKYKKCCLLAA